LKFIPEQAEDYCFARAFNIIDSSEGEKRWPSLRTHESDRIVEMDEALSALEEGKEIKSKDHRVVQAIVMKAFTEGKEVKILSKNAVDKSWPQFWDFIEATNNLVKK